MTATAPPHTVAQNEDRRRVAAARRRRKALTGWAFLAPLLALNVFVIGGPGVMSLVYSFTDWTGIGPAHFVGLQNYLRLFTDDKFLQALVNNIWWMLFFLIVPVGLALAAAFLLSRTTRGQMAFRVIFFIPYTLATIVVATIWENIYSPVYGITAVLGLDINVLGNTSTALPGVAVANTWQWWGYLMVVFIAAMASVNPSLYEAAKLDGASGFQQFLHITIPGIRPTLVFMGLMTIIWSFLVFDYIYIMTGGGPAGSTEVVGSLLYTTAFSTYEAGYAAAMGIVLALISTTVICAYLGLRRWRGWDI
ncbi:carbohydrate ABC transporter permease [Brachybacterium sacelli]|uniref:Raffinose/stachyose/melibiose transport system permease protein n=1 Tax=Brachybacterium sacelli TaxID=173364 RepID=A0ABS4WYX5_9MICO|nr:sugar ABC transporter permease [Brachybacterium sacelli]MBP2381410.1 raffinose/stachyose/melibiose transport system permease protein [Brachybacterium sacelli]